MIAPTLVTSIVKHAWAAAVIAAAILLAAACDFPGTEQTAPPATTTPAARPAGTRLPPATVTAGTTAPRAPTPAVRAVATPSPVTSPEAPRLTRAATRRQGGGHGASASNGGGVANAARGKGGHGASTGDADYLASSGRPARVHSLRYWHWVDTPECKLDSRWLPYTARLQLGSLGSEAGWIRTMEGRTGLGGGASRGWEYSLWLDDVV